MPCSLGAPGHRWTWCWNIHNSCIRIYEYHYVARIFCMFIHGTSPTRALSADGLMMTSLNGNLFRVTGHLCGEFTGHRWIPLTKGQYCGLWCFCDVGPHKLLNKQSSGMAGDLRLHDVHVTSSSWSSSATLGHQWDEYLIYLTLEGKPK